jgi:hypothetical protein
MLIHELLARRRRLSRAVGLKSKLVTGNGNCPFFQRGDGYLMDRWIDGRTRRGIRDEKSRRVLNPAAGDDFGLQALIE